MNNLIACMSMAAINLVATIGNFPTYGSGSEATASLNTILTSAGTAVGAIVAVVGIIKLMLSLADQNAVSKQQSSLLIGVGIFFLSVSTIVNELNIAGAASGANGQNQIGATIINIIGKMLSWSGALLVVVAIIMLILSIAQEQAESKAEAARLLGVGIGLLSVTAITSLLSAKVSGGALAATDVVDIGINFLMRASTYIGGGLVIMAVWHLVNSIREEDAKEKSVAIRFAMAGIALISIRPVLYGFGIIPSNVTM